MAQQADNIGGIQLPALNPMQLAAEAAEAERQEHIEAAQQAQQQQPKRQTRKKKVAEEQGDFGLSLNKKEKKRVPVALSFNPEMNDHLTFASFKLKTTRSAILERLFTQWWDEYEEEVKALPD